MKRLSVGKALRQGSELLEKAGIEVPWLTAEVLLAFALKRDRSYLYAHSDEELHEVEWIHFGRYLHERLKHKPTQYITHVQDFYGRGFYVSPDVLIPRPETEHVVEASLPLVGAGLTIDVGTGSGVIAVTLAADKDARVTGVDISEAALSVARRNADALGARVDWVLGDALTAFRDNSVELVVSNPPYVAEQDRPSLAPEVRDWEPALALFAGHSGFDFHKRLMPEAARVLKAGGHFVVELGAGQSRAVASLLEGRMETVAVIRDLSGIERVLVARKS